jgi:type II secretory pathway pseudopilin PulG
VEVLAVLAIAAILVGLVAGIAGYAGRAAREARARAELERIRTCIDDHALRNGSLPATIADVEWPAGCRLTLDGSNRPLDPWGAVYVYSTNGARAYAVYSTGKDQGATNDYDDVHPGID